jgi:hypothetical protein
MLSHETCDIDYDAGNEDLRILFKETDAYHTACVTDIINWNTILRRIQAMQDSLRKLQRLRNVRPHTLRRMVTAYRNW